MNAWQAIVSVGLFGIVGLAIAPVQAEETAPVASTTATTSEAKPATPPAAAGKTDKSDVQLLKFVLTKEVSNREPGAEVNEAKVGDVVYGWTQVKAESGEESLSHRWLHNKEKVSDVTLAIKSSPYRTWSKKTLTDVGSWTLQVLDSKGNVLAEKSITVNP